MWVISLIITWGVSRIMNLQNANIASALFILGVGGIITSIGKIIGIFPIGLILSIIAFLTPFILAKHIYQISWGRATWFVILNALVMIAIVIITGKLFGQSLLTFVKNQATTNEIHQLQKSPVDQNKLAGAKAMFPANFPMPNDTDVLSANTRQASIINPDLTLPAGADIIFISHESIEHIITTYTAAISAQGLKVVTRPSHTESGQTIAGNKVKKTPTGVEVIDNSGEGIHEIGVNILQLPDGSKRVSLWVNL